MNPYAITLFSQAHTFGLYVTRFVGDKGYKNRGLR